MELKDHLIQLANEEGFPLVGFANVSSINDAILSDRINHLQKWLENGFNGTMQWLQRHWKLRHDPGNLFSDAQTIMCCGAFPGFNKTLVPGKPKIASYAKGRDYHIVLKERLNRVLKKIKLIYPELKGRSVVDTAPLDEKGWAQVAGLGFVGKNTLLINPERGSFLHLGELLLNTVIEPDISLETDCRKCNLCIEACPSGALSPYQLNAGLCLSYLTIEHKKDIKGELHGWVFGCEICQMICPYNKKEMLSNSAKSRNQKSDWQLLLNNDLTWEYLFKLSKEDFIQDFQETPLERIGYDKFRQNVHLAYKGFCR